MHKILQKEQVVLQSIMEFIILKLKHVGYRVFNARESLKLFVQATPTKRLQVEDGTYT